MPISPNALFHRPSLQKAVERHLDLSKIADLPQKRAILAQWRSAIASAALQQSGEVALHGDFLIDIFARVLGYTRQIESPAEWQLAHEQKTLTDATKADGALGFFTKEAQDIRAVIELKSVSTDLDAKQHHKHDKSSPVEQAFAYAHKSGEQCQWIIVSNYAEIRLYHASFSGKCETFRLMDLAQEDEFKRFYFLLAREFLLAKTGESAVEMLRRQSQTAEKNITEKFYAEYSQARRHLFDHLKQQNPQHDDLTLLACTQRLLDRFIFIYFCEDDGDLLPEKTFRKLIRRMQESFVVEYEYGTQKIWREFKAFFRALDEGLSSRHIPGFNGELFKPDALIDSLRIEDDMLIELAALSDYDFRSDLNVNILGHIFEQSISDLEELRAEIRGETLDRKQGKRKKEGVFYTPEYVTRYIVEQAVGGWLAERRRELGEDDLPELTPEDDAWIASTAKKKPRNERIERHIAFWEAYLEQVKQITVLDPACGSGAFLTQAFDFLMQEGEQVNREINRLRRAEQLGLFSRKTWEKTVLRNNLYGVDLNGESVEITKLALWLKTAKKDDRLTALNDHIRCGNSLIDDPAVAGERAFDWAQAFPQVMARGGFDVVIGNPPYVQSHAIAESHKTYFYNHYHTAEYQLNTFGLFLEKSLTLLKERGFYSLIIPNYWLSTKYDEKLRRFLFLENRTKAILNLFQVFESASVDTVIILGERSRQAEFPKRIYIKSLSSHLKRIEDRLITLEAEKWAIEREIVFENTQADTKISFEENLELQGQYQLSDFVELKQGMKPYQVGKGNPPQTEEILEKKIFDATTKIDDSYLPLLRARGIKRYLIVWENDWIKYGQHLAEPRSLELFQGERILIRRIISGDHIEGTLLSETYINNTDLINILPKSGLMTLSLKVLAAILLSKLCAYVLKKDNVNLNRETFPKINVETLKTFPIPNISDAHQQSLTVHVEKMLELNRQLHAATQKFTHFLDARYHPKTLSNKLLAFDALAFDEFLDELKKQKVALSQKDEFELLDLFETHKAQIAALRRDIEQTDRAIDAMVYALYGLTDDEIRLVEGM